MVYEHNQHDGALPLVGVNICLPKEDGGETAAGIELIRSTQEEKGQQIETVCIWQKGRNVTALSAAYAPALPPLPLGEDRGRALLAQLPQKPKTSRIFRTLQGRRNVFETLMEAIKTQGLEQIGHALV